MEQESNLFQLSLDATGKSHMMETAKWARFLAIAGFIALGLIVIAIIIAAISGPSENSGTLTDEDNSPAYIVGTIIGGLLVVLFYFFPCYFLLRFADKMKLSLLTDDMVAMNEAFKNLKITFRYVGIMTIIFVTLFLIGLLAGITGG